MKTTRSNVSRYLIESILEPERKWTPALVTAIVPQTRCITFDAFLITYLDFCPRFQEKWLFFSELDQSTRWSVFVGGGRGSLSYIQGALPQSSISKFDRWCWCHFSNASTGAAICMTPPQPQFTTNSLFNTFAKSPVCPTVFFNLLHFHPC